MDGFLVEDGLSLDIELTNRCNAKCHFCPRDATPHQGIMTPEVFAQSLIRGAELRDALPDRPIMVNLCGLGEPLINRNAPTFVRQARDAGFVCGMSSNASLLDESRGQALLDAGLQEININVADRDETYEQVYRLPFQRTHDNVVRFAEMAAERCIVNLVLVDYRRDSDHLERMREYWRQRGVTRFMPLDIMNRGGALFVDDMQFEAYPQLAEAKRMLTVEPFTSVCAAPFLFPFIGYDGLYYLCCSDWRKEVPLGSVFDTSFLSIAHQKLSHVNSREPICKSCNHDPTNRLTEVLRAIEAGEAQHGEEHALVAVLDRNTRVVRDILDTMDKAAMSTSVEIRRSASRRIPLTVD